MVGGGGALITSVESWRAYAAPKGGDLQWVDGRSAKELAKAWCLGARIEPPLDFVRLLESHEQTRDLRLLEGYPEWKTGLRGERRGPRVHDLLLVGKTPERRVVIGVEAKADEAFDRTLQERWSNAQARLLRGEATNWPARLRRLTSALLGLEAVSSDGTFNPEVADVPYQLVSALAGTLIEAEERSADLAVLAVHVFATSRTRIDVVAKNKKVFATFVERVAGIPDGTLEDGRLYGPFAVPGGGGIPNSPVLIGTVTSSPP